MTDHTYRGYEIWTDEGQIWAQRPELPPTPTLGPFQTEEEAERAVDARPDADDQ